MNNNMPHDEISLKLLDELVKEPSVTQRSLADSLGIALGLVNAYVKRLCKKGHIKITTLPRNRIRYIVTPKGFAEKTRLTYSYIHYSIDYFRESRQKIERAYEVMVKSGVRDVLLWGDGELAELCYISTRGLPLNVVGIVGEKRSENGFFGLNIYTSTDLHEITYDAIMVSTLEKGTLETIYKAGVSQQKVYCL